jgi:hypothetical protein
MGENSKIQWTDHTAALLPEPFAALEFPGRPPPTPRPPGHARGIRTALWAERDRVWALFDLACVEVSRVEAEVINALAEAPGKPPSPTV